MKTLPRDGRDSKQNHAELWAERRIVASGGCYNPGNMPLQTLRTISRNKPVDFKYVDGEEIIVYSSDDDGRPQREHAIVITRFEQQIVKDRIHDAGVVVVGASRDRPPRGSLGELLKQHDSSPQILSYFSAILVHEGYCSPLWQINVLALERKQGPRA